MIFKWCCRNFPASHVWLPESNILKHAKHRCEFRSPSFQDFIDPVACFSCLCHP
jgi:hypothetical protein